jgi:glycosyltransferase involved in cell wall biosynthesis
MTTVVISPSNVADYPEGGGHFWVYMQYVQGLRALGCEVYWLEHFHGSGDERRDKACLRIFLDRLRQFDLSENVMIHRSTHAAPFFDEIHGSTIAGKKAEKLCERADLLLNFSYAISPDLLSRFRQSALIDIDPGLLQFWMSQDQLQVPGHDLYFSTGETTGKPDALFPDCGISWHRIRPVVSLRDWPVIFRPESGALTTISGWWGGGEEGEWITDGRDICYENNKRVSFMQFAELPRRTNQAIELALCLGEGDSQETDELQSQERPDFAGLTDYQNDEVDRAILEAQGWRVRLASEVAACPDDYRSYIQNSRGEFSCAKPSCMKFQNAWVSDRSLCYLASGKPVIVQNTGPSEFLPDAEGMFRFNTVDDALSAIDAMNSDYNRHCSAARELAAMYFDAEKVLASVLDLAV